MADSVFSESRLARAVETANTGLDTAYIAPMPGKYAAYTRENLTRLA